MALGVWAVGADKKPCCQVLDSWQPTLSPVDPWDPPQLSSPWAEQEWKLAEEQRVAEQRQLEVEQALVLEAWVAAVGTDKKFCCRGHDSLQPILSQVMPWGLLQPTNPWVEQVVEPLPERLGAAPGPPLVVEVDSVNGAQILARVGQEYPRPA